MTFDLAAVPRPSLTVDMVVLTVLDDGPRASLRCLLVRRGLAPFLGALALPGGFVRVGDGHRDKGESVDDAARRELEEETGLPPRALRLEQIGAFGRPYRDPRRRVITVAYAALVRPEVARFTRAGSDAATALWLDVEEAKRAQLAFDHAEILAAALARVRADLWRSTAVFHLVPATFTIPELRRAHELVLGQPVDAPNFHRKLRALVDDGVVAPAPGKRGGARVYALAT